jgi:hypothetical protein
MNQGMYGYGLPPNYATRVAPPKFVNEQSFIVPGTYSFTVPQNVYQIFAIVIGAGGSGATYNSTADEGVCAGGAGGGCAVGIIDVIPGQLLPTITVGAGGAAKTNPGTATASSGNAGGTSSIGSLLSATGGAEGTASLTSTASIPNPAGGTGSVSATLRGGFIATGGNGGGKPNANSITGFSGGGGAAGTPFGNGGHGGSGTTANAGTATGGGGAAGGHAGTSGANGIVTGGGGFATPSSNSTVSSGTSLGGAGGNGQAPIDNQGGNGLLGNGARTSGSTLPTSQVISSSYSLLDRLTNPGIYNGGGGASSQTIAISPGAIGGGGGGVNATATGPSGSGGAGAGGGGHIIRGASLVGSSGSGGTFGGGGGINNSGETSNAGDAIAGSGGIGAGGGAAGRKRLADVATSLCVSGAGGHGLVLLAWTEGY